MQPQSSCITWGTLFYFLPGVRTSGLLPRGVKKEVGSSWSINLHDKPVHRAQITNILPSLRPFWRNRVSLIPSATCWASASSSGRELGTTSVSGSIVSKNPPYAGPKITCRTRIGRIRAQLCCIHAPVEEILLGSVSSPALTVKHKIKMWWNDSWLFDF